MNDFELQRNIIRHVRSISRGITSATARKRVCEEYVEHMQDMVNRLMLNGINEQEAFEQACLALGDVSEIALQLEQIHNLPALPHDIKKLRRQNIYKTLFGCFGTFAGILTVILLFGNRLFGAIPTEGKIILETILCAVPFIIFRVPLKIFDRSFEGVITHVSVKTVYNTTDKLANKLEYYYHENINILTIKTANGKEITYKFRVAVNRYNLADRPVKDRFEVGDVVRHYAGFEHLQLVSRVGFDVTTCIVCGMQNPTDNSTCAQCGHTLIQ